MTRKVKSTSHTEGQAVSFLNMGTRKYGWKVVKKPKLNRKTGWWEAWYLDPGL